MTKGKSGIFILFFVLMFLDGGCSDNQATQAFAFVLPWNVLPRTQFGYTLGETLDTAEKEFEVSENETIPNLIDYKFAYSENASVILSVDDQQVIQLIYCTVTGYDETARENLMQEVRSKYAGLIYNEFNDNINDNFFARDNETEMIFTIGPDKIFISLMNRQYMNQDQL